MVDGLKGLRHMQLNMLYYRLGLEDPTDNVALDVEVTWTLLDEFPVYAQISHVHTQLGFVAKVEEVMRLDGLKEHPHVFIKGVGWHRK